ncbi:MAG: cation-translocating P-type ATPase, partial [Desulfovibrionales bacterium]
RFGPNKLRETVTRTWWEIFLEQWKNLIVLLLAIASLVSLLLGQTLESVAIAIALLINVLIGFFTELKAVRSMEALKRMSRTKTAVLRDGEVTEVPSDEIVPGDIVILESGDIIPADLRIIESARMQANESSLTGESVPVSKNEEPVEAEAPMPERSNILFKGTALTMGSGKAAVYATGMDTELGHISEMAEEAESEETPLEQRLTALGKKLIWVTLGVAAVIGLVGFFAGMAPFLIFETAIALAVAAIPEGLPIVATIALARGMWRMARRNALVNRLSSVETLGSTNIIFTDKTGTLTENKMHVKMYGFASGDGSMERVTLERDDNSGVRFTRNGEEIDPLEHPLIEQSLKIGVLCNNAHLSDDEENTVGDPLEVALLEAGREAGIERDELLESLPEEREEAFDPEINMMATVHRQDQGYFVAVKGAPESVVQRSTAVLQDGEKQDVDDAFKERLLSENEDMAAEGLRMLGLASKQAGDAGTDTYEGIEFTSLVGLLDPPRAGIEKIIDKLRHAGIRVVMVTGDQPKTAQHIGRTLGLVDEKDRVVQGKDLKDPSDMSPEEEREMLDTAIFARISPEQKLNLIALFQKDKSVVAMTGDGVNDAPALRKADIGVAMGKRGTQVAREAADIVLKDDSFATIAAAVEQGRIIFRNIRKFILFLLSGNVGQIMIVAFAILMGMPLPLLPLQILYLNMISDVFPALALGVGKGDPSVMDVPPRDPEESIVTAKHWQAIGLYGVIIAAAVLTALWLALDWAGFEKEHAVSISFLTLAFARTWHVFNMRETDSGFFVNEVTRNPFVWGAIGLSIALLLVAIYVPPLAHVRKLVPPGTTGWGLILGMSLVPFGVIQLYKIIARGLGGSKSAQQHDSKEETQ